MRIFTIKALLVMALVVAVSGVASATLITNVDRSVQLAGVAAGYTLDQIRLFIDNIQAAGEQLQLNANPQLALEVLMLSVPERAESRTRHPMRGK